MSLRLIAPISCVFAFHGLILGAWATQVPLLRERLCLSPGTLGVALFCASAGAVLAMPATSRLVTRFGAGAVIRVGAAIACVMFVLSACAPGTDTLCAALAVFGMAYGIVDVAMNAVAVRVEHAAGRTVLGRVHAMWSVGSFAGSAGGATLLAVAAPAMQAAALAVLSGMAILMASYRLGIPLHHDRHRAVTHRPWRDHRLLLTGAVLCLAFAVEGAVADWGGIYLRVVRHVAASQAALGYSAFSLSMVAMRLAGDALRTRMGNGPALLGAFLAAAGIGCVLAASGPVLALTGFALTGLGVANVVPALFAMAGARGDTDSDAAVGVVATIGYAGVLAGPPLFGFVAQATSLATAIGLIGGLCCLIGAAGMQKAKPFVSAVADQ